MIHNRPSYFIYAALLTGLCSAYGCQANTVDEGVANAGTTDSSLVLTDVDFNPATLLPETQPVADYLGKRLKRVGIVRGAVQIAPDVDTVTQWIASGEVDVYFDSVYPAMLVMEKTGAQPLLRRWKDGVPEYGTYFVSKRDGSQAQLADLEGEMITLQEPSSSSGFMFPMVYMLEAGLNPVEKPEANHEVESDEVGYVFSGREETTVEWVLEEKVSAGAIDSETWEELPEEARSQLKIIAETEKFPRHVVLVSPTLPSKQVEALKKALIKMDGSRSGRTALEAFSNTSKFDEFPNGSAAEIDRLNGAYTRLQKHLAQFD